jgi:hypothetical protein
VKLVVSQYIKGDVALAAGKLRFFVAESTFFFATHTLP